MCCNWKYIVFWCRVFAVFFTIFFKVCRVFSTFLPWFSTVPSYDPIQYCHYKSLLWCFTAGSKLPRSTTWNSSLRNIADSKWELSWMVHENKRRNMRYLRSKQACLERPDPPNLIISIHARHLPQSDCWHTCTHNYTITHIHNYTDYLWRSHVENEPEAGFFSSRIYITHSFHSKPCRSRWLSGRTPDCGVRGPRFESHHGRLCLSRQSLRYTALGTGCAPLLQCLGWLSLLPSVGR